MRIVAMDNAYLEKLDREKLSQFGEVITYDLNPSDENEALQRIEKADIILNFWYPLSKRLLEATAAKLICVTATDWIDMETAQKRSITISKVPSYSTEAVAEHTILLMLAAARKLKHAQSLVEKNIWDSTECQGIELEGKTLGIIGYGSIGKRVAAIAEHGFGMKILTVTSTSSTEAWQKLLSLSDIISLHSAATPQTGILLDQKEFTQMKEGVIIINTARGRLINETAFLTNINNKKIAAAALDVLSREPNIETNILLKHNNILITPHIGYNTQDMLRKFSHHATAIVERFLM